MDHTRVFFLALIAVSLLISCDNDDDGGPSPDNFVWEYEDAWGSGGTGNGQFNLITGLAVDDIGTQYLTDINQNRIQKISSSGAFLTKWGTKGSANGQFDWPRDVAIDSDGNIWVVDQHNCRIQKFDPDGNFISSLGSCGSANGQFMDIFNIEIDNNNVVYAVDPENQRIQKFSLSGAHQLSWSYNQQLGFPSAIAADAGGDIYVGFNKLVDTTRTATVVKYNSSGTVQDSWVVDFQPDTYIADMDFDSQDNLHIGGGEGSIRIYSADGVFIKEWGEKGSGQGQILGLSHLAFGPNDDLYVAGCAGNENCRISMFSRVN